jgi:hypothetical protein
MSTAERTHEKGQPQLQLLALPCRSRLSPLPLFPPSSPVRIRSFAHHSSVCGDHTAATGDAAGGREGAGAGLWRQRLLLLLLLSAQRAPPQRRAAGGRQQGRAG